MKRHFFIEKTNTIFQGLKCNTGFSPILKLIYGAGIKQTQVSRVLMKIDTSNDELVDLYNNTNGKLKFTINFKNCGSIRENEASITGPFGENMERASDFELILFKLPFDFEQGKGSSSTFDAWYDTDSSYTTNGSTWKKASNILTWKPTEQTDTNIEGLGDGVYTIEYLKKEYKKFTEGEESIIVASQKFEFGNENLCMDITGIMKDILDSKIKNFGFGLSFAPIYEESKPENLQYVGFFSDKTNTFFHPYLEVETEETISDSRYSFSTKNDNRLYLYINDENDEVKKVECKINEKKYNVIKAQKGVYYAEIPANSIKGDNYSMVYDEWRIVAENGVEMDSFENSFVIIPKNWSVKKKSEKVNYVPLVYGINDNEKLNQGNEIEVEIDFVKEYDSKERKIMPDAEYRLYVKENNSEITVFDFTKMDVKDDGNSFMIYTQDLIPNKYYLDIRVNEDGHSKEFKDCLHFNVVNNSTNRYF